MREIACVRCCGVEAEAEAEPEVEAKADCFIRGLAKELGAV